ncbi:MAG: quinone oxidoreductase [Propionicimonas sp.]
MHAVVAREPGGPEVLEYTELPDPSPGPGQLLVEVAAAGVNFIDTYRRAGVYRMPFPHVVGSEGAGRVVATGPEVAGFVPGDRVSWDAAPGSYADLALVPAANAVRVPDGVDLTTAGALPLQGMTAHYLVNSTFAVQAGQDVLLHAGAGGVGLLLTQLAVARGGRVITTVGSEAKAALSREAGAAEVIDYSTLRELVADLPPLVRELTGGDGVHVAYDGVGRATFDASLASLRRRGMLVLFGGSSGQVPPVDLQRLNAGGSLYVTRPTLGHYTATRDELEWRMADLFGALTQGSLRLRIGVTLPLARAADAHRALEGRQTTGKVVLLP